MSVSLEFFPLYPRTWYVSIGTSRRLADNACPFVLVENIKYIIKLCGLNERIVTVNFFYIDHAVYRKYIFGRL